MNGDARAARCSVERGTSFAVQPPSAVGSAVCARSSRSRTAAASAANRAASVSFAGVVGCGDANFVVTETVRVSKAVARAASSGIIDRSTIVARVARRRELLLFPRGCRKAARNRDIEVDCALRRQRASAPTDDHTASRGAYFERSLEALVPNEP